MWGYAKPVPGGFSEVTVQFNSPVRNFFSALLIFNPEQYLFPPVLAQRAHLCLLSFLTRIFLLSPFIPPASNLGFIVRLGFWVFHWLQGPCRSSWLHHCWSGCCWCPGELACYWLWELLLGPVIPCCQCHSKKGWVFPVHHCPSREKRDLRYCIDHLLYQSTLSCLVETGTSLKSHPGSPNASNISAMSLGSLNSCNSPDLLTTLVFLLVVTVSVNRMSLARATEYHSDLRDVSS